MDEVQSITTIKNIIFNDNCQKVLTITFTIAALKCLKITVLVVVNKKLPLYLI